MADVMGGTSNGILKRVRAGRATISVGGADAIVLNLEVQFGRQIENVPAIGQNKVFSIGEPQGTLTIGSVYSNADILGSWSDPCAMDDIVISFGSEACEGMLYKTITCKNCMLQSAGAQAQGGRGYVAENLSFVFQALDM